MKRTPQDNPLLLRRLLDAIPAFVLVVDEDVSIHEYNAAAGRLLDRGRREILRRRGGDVLHCIHARDAAGGCGRGPFCRACLIRRTVKKAVIGTRCVRRRVRMELQAGDKKSELYILVSASPFFYRGGRKVLLMLEDIGELLQLQNLLPICIGCKRVRDEHRAWKDVDAYLKRHLHLLLTNSYCPECLARQAESNELQQRVATLTPREYEVFSLVIRGRLNKQIADVLGTSEKTIKVHRSRVMDKMRVQSLAELVHFADKLGLLSKLPPDQSAGSSPPANP